MDFNTGTGGAGSSGEPPPASGGGSSGPSASPAAVEFRYTDPVQTFVATVRGVVTQPAAFFGGILRQGDFVNPLIFAIICYEVAAILTGIIGIVVGRQGIGALIGSIFGVLIGGAIGLFIGAGIIHLLVMLIVGSRNSGFEATFRVLSYSTVTSLVSWIPFIGWIASLYAIYLGIVGIREIHNTTTGKAAIVVLIPVVVIFLLILALVALVGAALFFSAQQ